MKENFIFIFRAYLACCVVNRVKCAVKVQANNTILKSFQISYSKGHINEKDTRGRCHY